MHWGDGRVRQAGLGLVVGVVAAAVGLLPWAVTGMHLPLQNLWADPDTSPGAMPIALLPFSQYRVALLAALVVVGSAAAAGTVRLLRSRLGSAGRWSALAGVLMVQSVALLQSKSATQSGLGHGAWAASVRLGEADASDLYLTALVVGTVAAMTLAAVVFLALTSASPAAALVALAIAAIAFGSWCNGLVAGIAGVGDETTAAIFRVTRWVPAVVTGLGIAASRLRTATVVSGAVVAVALVWVGTAAVTAASSAVGSRVLLSRPRELVDYGVDVFRAALGPAGDGLSLAVGTALIGVAGAVVATAVVRRRREPEPA